MAKQTNTGLEAISFTLQRQDEQSKALQLILGEMTNMRDETRELAKEMQIMNQSMKEDIEKMNDRIYLEESELDDVQEIIKRKATHFTNLFFEEDVHSNLFIAKHTQIRMALWRKMKKNFNVRSYLKIKHKNYEDAMEFARNLQYSDLEAYELRMTAKQIAIMEKGEEA